MFGKKNVQSAQFLIKQKNRVSKLILPSWEKAQIAGDKVHLRSPPHYEVIFSSFK